MSKTILFSILGAFTGLIVSQISNHSDIKNIEIALFAFSLWVASYTLVLDKIPYKTMLKFLALLGLILSGITLYHFSQGYQSIRRIGPIFSIALIQISVICTAFFQSWKSTKPHYTYHDLFENAWNNHFFYIFSGLLMGTFLLILGLGGNLFDLLGFKASKMIWNENVTPVIIGTLLGTGIGISREYDQLIFKFRSVFFALFRILAYLTAAIVILFTSVLFFSIDILYANKDTSLILLSIVAVSIVLLNALEDTDSDKLPLWVNRIFSLQIILLPILVGVSLYAIYLRIAQYGLMPNRIVALWAALLIGAHVLGYLIQLIINKGRWKLGFAKVNSPLAFVWVLSIVLLASPLLDPIKLSVKSQVARLQNNEVSPEQFDFHSLKFRLGEPGKAAIKEIQGWTDHPQIALINEGITKTKSPIRSKETSITVIGEAPTRLNELKKRFRSYRCNKQQPCFIKKVRLKKGGTKQPIVFIFRKISNDKLRLETEYFEYTTRWKRVKTYKSATFDRKRMADIIESIKQQEIKLIQPEYSDIEIDGIQLKQ